MLRNKSNPRSYTMANNNKKKQNVCTFDPDPNVCDFINGAQDTHL